MRWRWTTHKHATGAIPSLQNDSDSFRIEPRTRYDGAVRWAVLDGCIQHGGDHDSPEQAVAYHERSRRGGAPNDEREIRRMAQRVEQIRDAYDYERTPEGGDARGLAERIYGLEQRMDRLVVGVR